MSESKVIYENGFSSLEVNFDGELIELVQFAEGEQVGYVSLYVDEMEKLIEYTKTLKGEE